MGWREKFWEVIPFVAMISVECTDVGQNTFSKAAMSRGMSPLVYVVYSNGLGTLIFFPYFLLQRKQHPPLTFPILCRFIILGLLGICFAQILLFNGIRYSSPTLSSTLSNLIPAFTFLLAVIFRMEKFNWRSSSSQAKSLGTIIAISGAFIITLYKGAPIIIIPSPSPSPNHFLLSSQWNWVIGSSLLVLGGFSTAILYIVQASTMKEYPSKMNLVFFSCLFGTILTATFSLITEKDYNAWKLKSKMDLVAIVYSAIFGAIYRSMVHIWGIDTKGPVYVSMFRPLGIIVAIGMGVTFLNDTLYIGSVIGAIVITLGFYVVMWGKVEEEKMLKNNDVLGSEPPTQKVPFLLKRDCERVMA